MNRVRFVSFLASALVIGCGSIDPSLGESHPINGADPVAGSTGTGGDATSGSAAETSAETTGAGSGTGGGETSGGDGGSNEGGSESTGTGAGAAGGAEAGAGGGTTTSGGGGNSGMISTTLTPVYDRTLIGAGQSFTQSVAVAPNDDVVAVGTFVGNADFGCGAMQAADSDIFVARYDASGSCLWSKRFGSDDNPQLGAAVAIDGSGNVLLAGTFIGDLSFGGPLLDATGSQFSDVYVAKLGPNGNHLWSKRFGDINGQEAHAVVVDGAGSVIVTGIFQNEIDFGGSLLSTPGHRDAYLLKLDASGSHVFSKQFGDATKQNGLSVAVADNGTIVLGGTSEGDVDFGGGTLDNDSGDERAFLAWFTAAGAHLQSELFVGGKASIDALDFAPNGELLVGGNFKTSIDLGGGVLPAVGFADDIVVGRFGADGSFIEAIAIGDAFTQRLTSLSADANGAAIVGGRFTGTLELDDVSVPSQGSFDGFVLKIDATAGHRFWTFGDAAYQTTSDIGLNSQGDLLAVGDFSGFVDFGSGTVTGESDSFVAAYAQ